MKKIISILILSIFLIAGCNNQITNFQECAVAGNPIMESYPRQCSANGQNFVEEIQIIGGDRDENGCLTPAGYSYDSNIKACTRNWEIKEEDVVKAARIAVQSIGEKNGLTVVEVNVLKCPGCFKVVFDTYGERKEVDLLNWEVTNSNNYCSEESRKAEMCTELYKPVCGWFSEKIKCIKYPCAQEFSNECFACANENIGYWTEGKCPQ